MKSGRYRVVGMGLCLLALGVMSAESEGFISAAAAEAAASEVLASLAKAEFSDAD
ncbi:MAG: hypothetical protein WBS54_13280 [Acidobacteriota bacterium]